MIDCLASLTLYENVLVNFNSRVIELLQITCLLALCKVQVALSDHCVFHLFNGGVIKAFFSLVVHRCWYELIYFRNQSLPHTLFLFTSLRLSNHSQIRNVVDGSVHGFSGTSSSRRESAKSTCTILHPQLQVRASRTSNSSKVKHLSDVSCAVRLTINAL